MPGLTNLVTTNINKAKSKHYSNIKHERQVRTEDLDFLQMSEQSYKKERKDIGNYKYKDSLSNELIATYENNDNQYVVAFRGTATASEAAQTWLRIGLSERTFARSRHQKDIQKFLDDKVFPVIGNNKVVFTGHSKGGTTAILETSKVKHSTAVVFNPGQGDGVVNYPSIGDNGIRFKDSMSLDMAVDTDLLTSVTFMYAG